MIRRTREALLAAALCAGPCAADCDGDGTTLASIRARGEIRIAHTNDYRPFSYRTEDGAPRGIDVDLGERLATALGVSVAWVDTSWRALASDLDARRFDIAMSGVSVTPERSRLGCFSAPYFTTGKTVMTPCAAKRRFVSLAELDRPDVTLLVNAGGTNERFVSAHVPHARRIVLDDNQAVIRALAAGEADAMITDAVEAQIETREDPALCVADPPPLFEPVQKAYWMPNDASWRAFVDEWLDDVTRRGELAAVIERHVAPKRSP